MQAGHGKQALGAARMHEVMRHVGMWRGTRVDVVRRPMCMLGGCNCHPAHVLMSSSRGDSRAAHLFGESDAFAVRTAFRTAFTPAWKCLGSSLAACSATGGGSQVLYMLVLLGMLGAQDGESDLVKVL